MSSAKQTTMTTPKGGDGKKKKNGKAARPIGEVDVARGEVGRDEAQTKVPEVSGHELRDQMQDAKEAAKAVQHMVRDIEKRNPSAMEEEEEEEIATYGRRAVDGHCGVNRYLETRLVRNVRKDQIYGT